MSRDTAVTAYHRPNKTPEKVFAFPLTIHLGRFRRFLQRQHILDATCTDAHRHVQLTRRNLRRLRPRRLSLFQLLIWLCFTIGLVGWMGGLKKVLLRPNDVGVGFQGMGDRKVRERCIIARASVRTSWKGKSQP